MKKEVINDCHIEFTISCQAILILLYLHYIILPNLHTRANLTFCAICCEDIS